jgi:hypothetical protein
MIIGKAGDIAGIKIAIIIVWNAIRSVSINFKGAIIWGCFDGSETLT